ncbi:MAG: 3-ketoacyl-ACP reductase [Lentisphaerae bacterium GWF2_45_14]|nr:MAG: 3-ketoacyl-ACP reductase [Lentisphaerae bacterium GWF2_45_14]
MRNAALVTGGARGIGLGISEALAKGGFDLAICGTKDERDVAESVDKLRAFGKEVLYIKSDISETDGREKIISEIKSRFGKLNLLVNNAGVAPSKRVDILDADEESFDRLININLKGPYFLTRLAAAWMVEQKGAEPSFQGMIINISSVSSDAASVNRGDYCISKAGISMATKLWAVRMSEFDIPVYEIRPGIIMTEMTSGVKEKYDNLIANGITLQKRWGFPEDIGRAVAMLARGDMAYSTGSVFNIDGGLTVSRF